MSGKKAEDESRDEGVLDVAIAILCLSLLLIFSAYILTLTSASNKYQIGLSEALRNAQRVVQQSSIPINNGQITAIATTTLSALGLATQSLTVQSATNFSGCPTEMIELSIENPVLTNVRITSSATQPIGFNTQCQ